MASVHDHESAPTYEDDWRRVTGPALLVLGETGRISRDDIDRTRSLSPSLTVTAVPRAGHDVHLDNPDGWRDVAERFLCPFRKR